MPVYDYKCPSCGAERKDVIEPYLVGVSRVICALCNRLMERQPAAPNFVVHGLSSKNGYSR